jgi:hypothetical protein
MTISWKPSLNSENDLKEFQMSGVIHTSYILWKTQNVHGTMRTSKNVVVSGNDREPGRVEQIKSPEDFSGEIVVLFLARADEVACDDQMITTGSEDGLEKKLERLKMFAIELTAKMGIRNVDESEITRNGLHSWRDSLQDSRTCRDIVRTMQLGLGGVCVHRLPTRSCRTVDPI